MGFGIGVPGGSGSSGGSGGSSGTRQRGYAKYQRVSTAQSIPNTTQTLFNFDTEVSDSLEGCTVTTGASWKVTANRAMHITLKVDFRTSAAENWSTAGALVYATIFKGGVASDHGNFVLSANGVAQSAAIRYELGTSLPIEMSSGQYLDVRIYHALGSAADYKGIIEISEEY